MVLDCTNEEDEAQQIVNSIAELTERGYVYKDMAILYRANFQSRVIEEVLSQHDIPFKIENGMNFFSRWEVKILIDYLRLIHDPDSDDGDEALKSVINIPNRYLGKKFVQELETYAAKYQSHLYAALKKMPVKLPYLKKNIQAFIGLIDPLIRNSSKIRTPDLEQAS